MGAPKGNEFWKLRSKHGRDKLFASPELLWQAACEYFEWCDQNPFYKNEQKKGNVIIPKSFDGKIDSEILNPIAKIPTERPYSITGLCLYLNCNSLYFRDFKKGLEGKDDQLSKDFSQIILRIEETIETQQFDGAMVGFFNPNIVARKLGLVDKQETEHKGSLSVGISKIKWGDNEISI